MLLAKTFGDALRDFRVSLGLSQFEFSNGICSDRQYKRIETNLSEPSAYTLNMFSNKYNIDFNNIYKFYLYESKRESYEIEENLNRAIIEDNDAEIQNICCFLENNIEKNKGEVFMHYCYGKALINTKNEQGLSYAIKGIKQEAPKFDGSFSSLKGSHLFSNVSYGLLNYIAISERLSQHSENSEKLFLFMIKNFEERIETDSFFYQSQTFAFSFYPKMIYNYCLLLWEKKEYEKAIFQIDKSVDLLTKHGSSRYLHFLLWSRCQSFYYNNQITEARNEYNRLVVYCDITNNRNYLNQINERIKTSFPLIDL